MSIVETNLLNDKLKKMENLLDQNRKSLAREMLLNKTMQMENDQLKRFVEELEARNETFVHSYKLYEDKWSQVYHALQFYKDFYRAHKDEIGYTTSSRNRNNYLGFQTEQDAVILN